VKRLTETDTDPFAKLIISSLDEMRALHAENKIRDEATLQEVRAIHEAIVRLVEERVSDGAAKDEAVVKTVQRQARISSNNAKISIETLIAAAATAVIIAMSDPSDRSEQVRKALPLVMAAWIARVVFIANGKPPEPKPFGSSDPNNPPDSQS
jgi:hypothetical protein